MITTKLPWSVLAVVLIGIFGGTVVHAQAGGVYTPPPESPVGLASQPFGSKFLAILRSTPVTSTGFAMNLFNRASNEDGTSRNTLISPCSAYFALSMALNGASGKTRDEMARVLGTTSSNITSINLRNQAALTKLKYDNEPKLEIDIADAIFSDPSARLKQSFIDFCRRTYGAQARNLNFRDPASEAVINAWCSAKTHGRITSIAKPEPNENIIITNAVYFKGTWANRFEKKNTLDDSFTAFSGAKKPVKMMHQQQTLFYFQGDGFRAVALPYVGRHQSMYIFLPDREARTQASRESQWASFKAKFTPSNWKQWMTSFHGDEIILSLPRFHVELSRDLTKNLKQLGMAQAFDQGTADFSNMVEPTNRAFITRVLQKTYMDVNEEGTEAAAVTPIYMDSFASAGPEPGPVEFRVDRPFVLALVDNDTSEILFLGSIVDF